VLVVVLPWCLTFALGVRATFPTSFFIANEPREHGFRVPNAGQSDGHFPGFGKNVFGPVQGRTRLARDLQLKWASLNDTTLKES
jgi:hypothetical protein